MLAISSRTLLAQSVAPAAAGSAVVTLQDAINHAAANDPAFAISVAARGSAKLDRSISRSTLLPQASILTEYLYTQPNGERTQGPQGGALQPSVKFIANNAIHEYTSQLLLTETVNATNFTDYKRAGAAAAKAEADFELSRRGLVVTVVSDYFAVVATAAKLQVAERAASEAAAFVDLTNKLEAGREVAHADVVKANLQLQTRQREHGDAQLAADKARLDLGVLLFPDPRTEYHAADSDFAAPVLPSREDSQAAAGKNNPDLRSALEGLRVAKYEVTAARTAYLPSLSFNYTYGIDAPQFAANGPDGTRNLGYSALAGLNLPVWDWLATHDRVKQSELRQKAAQVTLSFAQKQLVAQLEEFYDEARIANDQLASLDGSVTTAEESLRLTKMRYSAGEATALEVVDAQNALTVAETARANGTVRYRVALANLQTLTGTL